jgi:hypothetical protein
VISEGFFIVVIMPLFFVEILDNFDFVFLLRNRKMDLFIDVEAILGKRLILAL